MLLTVYAVEQQQEVDPSNVVHIPEDNSTLQIVLSETLFH